jgi:pimeloyl-ACP methyl ester carboxylesterase
MLIDHVHRVVLVAVIYLFSTIACSQESDQQVQGRTFLLVHGAWHGAWAFDKLADQLEAKGHRAISVDLPGHGLDPTPARDITLDRYVNKVVAEIDALEGDIVLVGHSMGGIVVSQVAEERAERLQHLVFIAGFMPRNGETMLSLASMDTEAMVYPNLVFSKDGAVSFFLRDGARDVFYNDCSENVAFDATLRLNSQPMAPYTQQLELTDERYGTVRRTYIKTLKDHAVTTEFQQRMIEWSPPDQVILMDSGHSPFLSMPGKLASALAGLD